MKNVHINILTGIYQWLEKKYSSSSKNLSSNVLDSRRPIA